jgi:hypothetical protein
VGGGTGDERNFLRETGEVVGVDGEGASELRARRQTSKVTINQSMNPRTSNGYFEPFGLN